MESEELHPITSLIVMVVGFGGLVLMPISAILLWSENRALAWIAIVATLLGLHPVLGLPLGIGFVIFAFTENVVPAVVGSLLALGAVLGLPMLTEYVAGRKKAETETDVIYDATFSISAEGPRYCRMCGTARAPNDRYCQSCGTPLFAPAEYFPTQLPPQKRRRRLKWAVAVALIVVGLFAAASYRNNQASEEVTPPIVSGAPNSRNTGAFATRTFTPVLTISTAAADSTSENPETPHTPTGQECLALLNWYNASVVRHNEVAQRYSVIEASALTTGDARLEASYVREVLQQQSMTTPPELGIELQDMWVEYYQTLIDVWTAAADRDADPPVTEDQLIAMQTRLLEQMEDVRLTCV